MKISEMPLVTKLEALLNPHLRNTVDFRSRLGKVQREGGDMNDCLVAIVFHSG